MKKIITLFIVTIFVSECAQTKPAITEPGPVETVSVNKIIFVTETAITSNLKLEGNGKSGVEGADNYCNSHKPEGVRGVFKALITDGKNRIACRSPNCTQSGKSEHRDWVLAPYTEYYRPNKETLIAKTDALGLFPGRLESSIGGYNVRYFFSGLREDYTSMDRDCDDWTNIRGGEMDLGGLHQTNSLWVIFNISTACDNGFYHLVCVEQ